MMENTAIPTYKLTIYLFLMLVLSLNLCGCSSHFTTLQNTQTTYDYTLASEITTTNFHFGHSGLFAPLVTNSIPDNNMYPLFFAINGMSTYMINQNVYFQSNGIIYEATPNSNQDSWDTTSIGIENICDLISDGTYLYCLTIDDKGIIYDPASHTVLCNISLKNALNTNDVFIELNCVGNEKAYFSAYDSTNDEQTHLIFTIDHGGQFEILKTSDKTHFLKPVYSDAEYFVYVSYSPDNTDTKVYVENLKSGSTNQICDQYILNMDDRNAPFYRWNDSFVFLISGKGICITDTDGSNTRIYTGDTSHGYALYENKMYFAGWQVVSVDLINGEQETLKFGDEDDFIGNINICDGNILLSRKEASSEFYTVHVIPLP